MALSDFKPAARASLALLFDRGYFNDDILTFERATTKTRVNQFGQIEEVAIDEPALDYDPATGELKGLLIEEGRENLITTNILNNWNPVSADINISNYGDLQGIDFWELDKTGSISFAGISRTEGTIPAGGFGVVSWFVKDVDYGGNVQIYSRDSVDNDSQTAGMVFSLSSTGTASQSNGNNVEHISHGFQSYGNGIYRIWYVFKNNYASTRTLYHTLRYQSSGSGFSFLAGYPQYEPGSFPTSYIPTAGSAVTRAADDCYIDGQAFSDFYKQDEGTFVVEVYGFKEGVQQGILTPINSANGSGTRSFAMLKSSGDDSIDIAMSGTYISDVGTSNEYNFGGLTKIGMKGDLNEYSFFLNGVNTASGTLGIDPTLNEVSIGAWFSTPLNGHIKRLLYFPVALPDADLELLTEL